MSVIHQWSLPSGGKLRWDAGVMEKHVLSLEGDKRYHIIEVRCALDFEEDEQSRVGTLKMVRADDGRFVLFTVDTPLMRFGYRKLDWDTKEEVIIGDLSLFSDDQYT